MTLAIAAVALAAAAYFIGELVSAPAREREALVRTAGRYGRSRPMPGAYKQAAFRKRALLPLVGRVSDFVLRMNPRMSLQSVQAKLQAAGMRDVSPEALLATRGLAGGGGVVLGLAIGAAAGGSAALMWPLILGISGYGLPSYIVSVRARKRLESAVAQLPDSLDLLAVSVEAGHGFDAAISKLTEHMEGPLIDEFELMLGEVRVGASRTEALRKLGERLSTPEISAFVRALIQADQLGISLGRILRIQATDTRMKRQAAAEERAAKAPIKMLFPTVLFIFPAMFIVIIGPAMMQITKALGG